MIAYTIDNWFWHKFVLCKSPVFSYFKQSLPVSEPSIVVVVTPLTVIVKEQANIHVAYIRTYIDMLKFVVDVPCRLYFSHLHMFLFLTCGNVAC